MEQERNRESESLLRIKEILFGDDLQSLATRLDEIKHDFSSQVEEQEKGFAQKLNALSTDNVRKIEALEKVFNEQKKQSDVLLKQIDMRMKQIEEKITTSQSEFDKKLEVFLQRVEDNTLSTKKLKEEVESALTKLRSDKVDKSEIAELFGMVINKLK